MDIHVAFDDPLPFLTLGLTQNLEFVAGGVVGLDKELQGILKFLSSGNKHIHENSWYCYNVPILSYHFVQLRQKSFKSARKDKSHNRKTLRFHDFFGPRSQKIVKLLCYRHAEIFFFVQTTD